MSTISPVLTYRDPRAAVDFLCSAFGLERRAVHEADDGSVGHAELGLGDDVVMFGQAGGAFPLEPGRGAVYVVVDDPDAHHARAAAAGAEVVMALTDQDYGSREYAARDPEGNLWSFGTYRPAATGTR